MASSGREKKNSGMFANFDTYLVSFACFPLLLSEIIDIDVIINTIL